MATKKTAAEQAYAAALKAIADADKSGDTKLSFQEEQFHALDRIPPEVKDLKKLTTLLLDNTAIIDLSPLQGMIRLEHLHLDHTSVTNFDPLQGMTGLQTLSLKGTPVTNLQLFQSLTGLHVLVLRDTNVSDLSPIAGMKELQLLFLDNTKVTRLEPLQSLTNLTGLSLGGTPVIDIDPLSQMTWLQSIHLNDTKVADFTPLQGIAGLHSLNLDQTSIADLTPIKAMTKLGILSINRTDITDLSPLQGMTGLHALWLTGAKVRDLRPIMGQLDLGKGRLSHFFFTETAATKADPKLRGLSLIEDHQERRRETIAYLKTLPPWPEPLPGDEPPAQPAPDPAVPLQHDDGVIALASAQITAAERDDPIRETLHTVLQDQVSDLIRVSGNLDEAAYTQACKLRDLLEVGLLLMNPLLVHLALEALRRIRVKTGAEADRDFLLAIEAVIETGPGLTLDTREVQLFVDRAQRNRIERLAEAQAEAQIRLAQSIADSGLSAVDLQAIARRAADESVYDQFTAIRPTLARNYTLEVGKWALVAIASGPMGEAGTLAVQWLAANAADIRSMASVWGEPFAVWIAPILEKAQQCVDGAKHLLNKQRKP